MHSDLPPEKMVFGALQRARARTHTHTHTHYLFIIVSESISRDQSDCYDVFVKGLHNNGVYSITPSGSSSQVIVYCEVSSNDGGWLVSLAMCTSWSSSIATTTIVIIIDQQVVI